MSLIARYLGLNDNYFRKRFTDDPTILFCIFNYPKMPGIQNKMNGGVREHTDYGFLTILK